MESAIRSKCFIFRNSGRETGWRRSGNWKLLRDTEKQSASRIFWNTGGALVECFPSGLLHLEISNRAIMHGRPKGSGRDAFFLAPAKKGRRAAPFLRKLD
jgi:hypothetical protein